MISDCGVYMSKRIKKHTTIGNNVMGILGTSLVLGFILTQLSHSKYISKIVSWLVIIFIILALKHLRGLIAIIVYTMLGLTVFFLIGNNDALSIIESGARTNLALSAIFISTPLLGIPVRTGDYIRSLKLLLTRYRNNVTLFYFGTAMLTQFLSVILNIGAVIINHTLVSASNVKSKRLIGSALTAGFAAALIWAPFFAAMALIISQLQVKWEEIFPYVFGFAMLSIVISYLSNFRFIHKESNRLKQENLDQTHFQLMTKPSEAIMKHQKYKLIELSVLIMLTLVLTLSLEKLPLFNMIVSICFISFIFPFFWCYVKGQKAAYNIEIKNHIYRTVPNLKQETTLFLTAGLFSSAFIQSPVNASLIKVLNKVSQYSVTLVVILLPIVIIVAAIVGFHPIIFITVFVTGIDPGLIGLTTEVFAFILLISWGLASAISPLTILNSLVASLIKEDLIKVSIYWNHRFVLLALLLLPIYFHLIIV